MVKVKQRNVKTRNYCQPCCSLCCVGFGLFFIITGAWLPVSLDNKIQKGLYEKSIKNPAEANWTHFKKDNRDPNGVGFILTYYFFNLTNPYEFQNGAQPIVDKLGPYVFQQFMQEGHIQYYMGHTIKAARKRSSLEFLTGRSNGKLNDVLYVPNGYASLFGQPGKQCNTGTTTNGLFCGSVGKAGLIEKTSPAGILWGHKVYQGKSPIVFRYYAKHQWCNPQVVPECDEEWLAKQYRATTNGQYSANWNAKFVRENNMRSGYGNQGCMKPFDFEDHGVVCSQFELLGRSFPKGTWKTEYPKQGPGIGKDYTTYSKEEQKQISTNTFKWYDDTPYFTGDDAAFDKTFDMSGPEPCKHDGSTDGKTIGGKRCPYMEKFDGHWLLHGLFRHARQNKEDLPIFNPIGNRHMVLRFEEESFQFGQNLYKYGIPAEYWKASKANKKYGMDSEARFDQFPGDGMWPMSRMVNGIPWFFSLPHWARGGDKAAKWNEDMTLRKGMDSDRMAFYYEPLTGIPFNMHLAVQLNTMLYPADAKVTNGTGFQLFDYKNLNIEGNPVNLNKLGKYQNCASPTSDGGCPVLVPTYIQQVTLELSTHTTERIKAIVWIFKKIGGLKTMLRNNIIWGTLMFVIMILSNIWYYYGDNPDAMSEMGKAV